MGILITFGSYMKKDVSIDQSTRQVEVFDTAIAILAGLMIIPAVFSFSGGDAAHLKGGPSLMFVTMPKIFASMGIGRAIGILFFLLFLTNSVMMPISAFFICLYVSRCMGIERVEAEVTQGGARFGRRRIFAFMIRYICPFFVLIILLSSIANAFGWISI